LSLGVFQTAALVHTKDITPEQLHRPFPSGRDLAYYIAEVEAFIERASQPLELLNGLPACPYAKQEMLNDRIQYEVIEVAKGVGTDVVRRVHSFEENPGKQTLVMMADDVVEMPVDDATAWAADLSRAYAAAHPPRSATDKLSVLPGSPLDSDGAYVVLPPFTFFLIQHSLALDNAVASLKAQGYYDHLSRQNLVEDGISVHPILEDGTCK
jgi:hypothetical protein